MSAKGTITCPGCGRRIRSESSIRLTVDAIIETFDRAFFESRTGYGVDSERLVFIVGMPRAGTSLLEQIIASHAAVFGAGEVTKIN